MSGDIFTQIKNSNIKEYGPWWVREDEAFKSYAAKCPSQLADNDCLINRESMKCSKEDCPFWYWKQFF